MSIAGTMSSVMNSIRTKAFGNRRVKRTAEHVE